MNKPTFRERFRYSSDRFFQTGFRQQLFFSLIVVLMVLIVFDITATLTGIRPTADYPFPQWPSPTFWWVVSHVLESYWAEDSVWSQFLGGLLTLFNFLVFATVIGLVGSKIQQRLEGMRRGTSRAIESDHIVIIGWSGKVIQIIEELFEGLELPKTVFAILSEEPIEGIEAKLRRSFRHRHGLRWVVRRGCPTDIADLQLVSIATARDIIILQPEDMKQGGDARVVKTVMAIAHVINAPNESRPFMIAEVEHDDMCRLARAAGKNMRLSIIQPADYLSKIVLQTARQNGLINVYNEMLSHSGNEIHTLPSGDLSGRHWREAVFQFPEAVLIGLKRNGKVMLAPDPADEAFVLRQTDHLVGIARNNEAMERHEHRTVPQLVQTIPGEGLRTLVRRILVLGYNEKTLPLLREFRGYARSAEGEFAVTLVSPAEIRTQQLEELFRDDADPSAKHRIDFQIVAEDYLLTGALEDLDLRSWDAVIVLGESQIRSEHEDADTRVIMTLLLLRSLREAAEASLKPFPKTQQIVSEILNPMNRELTESTGSARDIIISNDLISKMIAQICRDTNNEAVLRELFDEKGKELYFKSAQLYSGGKSIMRFEEILAVSLLRGEVAIGYDRGSAFVGTSVVLNPKKDEEIEMRKDMRVIVIAEHEW